VNAPRLLVIQPDPSDPPGPLAVWFAEAGADVDVRRLPEDSLPGDLAGYDGLTCLGGEMGAWDDAEHPWLPNIRTLLATAAGTGVPTLAICLGAQLLAAATGGLVTRGHDGPEVGPGLIAKKDAAWKDPLCADLPLMQDVMQFHVDAIEKLPPQAELLASAPRYPHQVYRLGRRAYGLQFHIETTPEVVREWGHAAPDLAKWAPESAFDEAALNELHKDIAETWRPFAHRFVELAAGRRAPAEPRPYSLPLA
jgi:GMP synthase-like glutamine amidotransferase